MGLKFISETQDNFRDYSTKKDREDYLIDYVQNQNQTLIKKKVYEFVRDKEMMEGMSTQYREDTHAMQENEVKQFYSEVTPAGKSRILQRRPGSASIISPAKFK